MPIISLSIDVSIIEKIDNDRGRVGFNISRSAWIKQACIDKLFDEKKNSVYIMKKLRSWYNSFPKRPFKEILAELENGKI